MQGSMGENDFRAELDRLIEQQKREYTHHLCFSPSEAQAYYIIKARGAGVQWKDIMAYCKSRGWSGSESTMLRWYRAQGEK